MTGSSNSDHARPSESQSSLLKSVFFFWLLKSKSDFVFESWRLNLLKLFGSNIANQDSGMRMGLLSPKIALLACENEEKVQMWQDLLKVKNWSLVESLVGLRSPVAPRFANARRFMNKNRCVFMANLHKCQRSHFRPNCKPCCFLRFTALEVLWAWRANKYSWVKARLISCAAALAFNGENKFLARCKTMKKFWVSCEMISSFVEMFLKNLRSLMSCFWWNFENKIHFSNVFSTTIFNVFGKFSAEKLYCCFYCTIIFWWSLIASFDSKNVCSRFNQILSFLRKQKEQENAQERMKKQISKKNHNYYRNMQVCTVLRPRWRWSRSQQYVVHFFRRRWKVFSFAISFCLINFFSYVEGILEIAIFGAYFVAKYTDGWQDEKI